MTGRAAGWCAGYGMPGYANPIPGRFWGLGGRGRGWRHWYRATGLPGWARAGWVPAWGCWPAYGWWRPAPAWTGAAPASELDALRAQAEAMEAALGEIRERIAELEKGSGG